MPIARKPNSNRKDSEQQPEEKAAEAFISGAAKKQIPTETEETTGRKIPVMIRFDHDLLQKIDAAAKRRRLSRSAWIQTTLSNILEQEN